jgi:primosomal protein N' (replication factor Y)
MTPAPLFANILLPLPVKGTFTYGVPRPMVKDLAPGMRVVVPFGQKKLYTGLVWQIHGNIPAEHKIKNIISILDNQSLIDQRQMEFWEWISRYYLCTPGEVMKAALPSGLKLESETLVLTNPSFSSFQDLSHEEKSVFGLVEKKNLLTVREVQQSFRDRNILPLLKMLVDKQAVLLEERIREVYKPKQEQYIRLTDQYLEEVRLTKLIDTLVRAPKQQELLLSYLHLSGVGKGNSPHIVSRKDLAHSVKNGQVALAAMIRKKMFIITTEQVSRLAFENQPVLPLNVLNSSQQKVMREINECFASKTVTLLHGVTSSGKTEIYIHLIKEQVKKGNQVLYLLPEIALTTQIIQRMRRFFGEQVAVYHSRFNDAERVEIWNYVKSGEPCHLVVGARSALFLPFKKLGLVIIDEEHENSFKQYDPAPRYHARDAAIYLAGLHGAQVILGTATPSVESYYNCQSGKYGLVELADRYLDIQLPEILLADTREATRKKQMHSHFTTVLLDHIAESLRSKEQVILFQNRRGFSPYIACLTCHWIPQCKHCDVTLTYHRHEGQLQCHYCGYSIKVPSRCGSCGSTTLATRGFGTQKVEEEIGLFFPDARIARLDLDASRSRKQFEKILHDFEARKTDILVGTQMVAKGLDFDNVGLVGILDADAMLNFPDFRAFERSYQLMAQVSGRAGRKNRRGKVIIQVSNPDHWVIRDVVHNDYIHLYTTQIKERWEFGYPPFCRLIKITAKHRRKELVNEASSYLAQHLREKIGSGVIGPEYPLIERLQGLFQKELMVKLERKGHNQERKDLIHHIIDEATRHSRFTPVQFTIDVDPL